MRALAALGLLWACMTHAATNDTAPVDLERYLGTWYELARYDHFFERGCVGVTATYSRLESGNVRVVNECRKETLDGELKRVTGKAWVPDPSQPGKLKVQFFWPFRSDYWVLDVAEDYSWALVGSPGRKACWILSRTPAISDPLYDELIEKLEARGYDPKKLIRVSQREAAEP